MMLGARYSSVVKVGLLILTVTVTLASESWSAAEEAVAVKDFPEVVMRPVTLWSDGTRLAGDLLYPKTASEDEKLPVIVMCHGWGGTKAHLNREIAPRFAAAGFLVLTFDYRGWGESDGRLVVRGEMPEPDGEGNVTVPAQVIRQLVDPFDQQEDIDAAISFVEGEALADRDRIGIWGSSFGGGHVVWHAAHDDRVKCVVAQVGSMDSRSGIVNALEARGESLEVIHQNRIRRARGELDPVPQGVDEIPGLQGTPYNERFVRFVPVDHADKITVPVLLIDGSEEHYFDIAEHSGRVYEILKARGVTTEYHVFEGMKHYDVYSGEGLDKVMVLEVPWFKKYLGDGE